MRLRGWSEQSFFEKRLTLCFAFSSIPFLSHLLHAASTPVQLRTCAYFYLFRPNGSNIPDTSPSSQGSARIASPGDRIDRRGPMTRRCCPCNSGCTKNAVLTRGKLGMRSFETRRRCLPRQRSLPTAKVGEVAFNNRLHNSVPSILVDDMGKVCWPFTPEDGMGVGMSCRDRG